LSEISDFAGALPAAVNPAQSELQQALQHCLQRLAPPDLTLAYSGGLDSQLLLHLLAPLCKAAAIPLTAVHIHHGLSANADHWAAFCQQQCQQLGVPFQLHRVKLAGRADLEQQAREARYQVLATYVQQPGSALLTAHHANDQLETLLLALKRGAGLTGLAGMAPSRPLGKGQLLRPWLSFPRQQLEAVATALQLSWVEDESNRNPDFERNFLRLQVVPALTERWPALPRTAARSCEHLQQALQLADYYTNTALASCLRADYLDLQQLALQPELQQDLVLRKWLASVGLNPSSQWLATLKQQVIAAKGDAQPRLILEQWQVRRFLQRLYLTRGASTEQLLNWQAPLQLSQPVTLPVGCGQLVWQQNSANGALPVTGEAWQLIFGQLSLPFKPVGQRTKPLKQWFKLWQVPPWQRGRIPLLLAEDKVQLVAGYASAVAATAATGWLNWQPPNWQAEPLAYVPDGECQQN
jgi:tRNA(Ile)-lysidine synthase